MRGRVVAGAVASVWVAACSSPSVPSPSAPATSPASIAVSSVVATVDKLPAGPVYHISFQLKETGGQSGATISSVLFTMPRGAATFSSTYTPPATQRVPAGGSLDLGPINIADTAGASTSIASEISVSVSFNDDTGRGGSAAATASITQPVLLVTYTVSGLVTDGTSGPSGRMRGVVVQVVDGANAGLSATTDDTGNYAITGISPGSLTLSASITGYEAATERVSVSSDTRVDFVLPQKTGPSPGPPPAPPPGPPPLPSIDLGTWTGTGADSMGTINLTWTLMQTGSAVSGSVRMQPTDANPCNVCHRDKRGTLSGTINGTTLALTIFFPGYPDETTPICNATLTGAGSDLATGSFTAAYSGVDSCEPPAMNGTLSMTRSP